MAMSDSDFSITNNQKVYVSGPIPRNLFHGYPCLAICKKCGLVETETKDKLAILSLISAIFCCCCFFLKQCSSEKYISIFNTIHYCPKCRKRLGIYKPC